ncbi:MAG TPA: NAD-dependent succinate-semialdehyde dehydrogenase [Gemmatimonadales bacterium]|jgi:succinate-semialdehyde dehydrogenase/glutarate-semialdehyde dehydrogenase
MSLLSINPSTGATVATYDEMSAAEVDGALSEAHRAFEDWRRTTFEQRAVPMRRAAALLRAKAADYGTLMATEMGKPVGQGKGEAEKCAWVCEYYADNAAQFLKDQPAPSDASKSYVTFQPLGPVLAVMPWNFPFWQVLRFAAPALMAGNTAVLKHAASVTGSALAIEQLFKDAGFPKGAFRTLRIPSGRVADVIRSAQVAAVTLTGSTAAGQSVASAAGSVLKKTVLELGGSDAYVVLDDADLDPAAETCVASRLINSGQSCIAAKRFIVVQSVLGRFTELFVERMRAKVVGDPFAPGVDLGPLARRDLRDELHRQVEASVKLGASVLLGGTVPAGPGAFYPPTVLAGVAPGTPAYQEELFGPVAAIIPARDEADAIRIANDSVFGLGAAVFTRDTARGERVAREFAAGACFVNAFVRSDPRLPFGGVKQSGYGRELSAFGIQEFVNVKAVYVK